MSSGTSLLSLLPFVQTGKPDAGLPTSHSLGELAQHFDALMQQATMAAPHVPSSEGDALVSTMIRSEDVVIEQSAQDLTQFAQIAPTMTMGEIVAEGARISWELTSVQLDLNVKMGVVESSKSAVETLMRNQ
jgi:type III secretion inner rod protein HrpB2